MLFRDLSTVDIQDVFDVKFVLFCAIATSICFWGVWGLAKIFMKDRTMIGAFTQASFRSSAAVMGLAFIQNIYGSATMGSLMIIGAVPLYNIYSVIVLTFEGNTPETERDAGKIRQAGINILKNPIIIGIVLVLIVALFHNPMPTLVNKTVDSIAQMATPLALVALGAGFEGRKAAGQDQADAGGGFYQADRSGSRLYPCCRDSWIQRRKTDRPFDHAGSSGNAKLLYHGKEYEQRRCAYGKYCGDNYFACGHYAYRMDLHTEKRRMDIRIRSVGVWISQEKKCL